MTPRKPLPKAAAATRDETIMRLSDGLKVIKEVNAKKTPEYNDLSRAISSLTICIYEAIITLKGMGNEGEDEEKETPRWNGE